MNIFIMILVALFMGTYYMLSSPSLLTQKHSTEYAITRADLRGIAECATAVHNASMHGYEFDDVCVEQNDIRNDFICLNKSSGVVQCDNTGKQKPAFSYIVTTTAPIPTEYYNEMMDLLDEYYSDAGTFGIFSDNTITAGGTVSRRVVPKGVISGMKLAPGQLVYMTQYAIPDIDTEYEEPESTDVKCPDGTVKTYRFGRWQCIQYNLKTNCGGDMIWDSNDMKCIPDESRKPLCANQQTAVIIDDVWECIDPFPDKTCPSNMISRLNYETLEWECVNDPNNITTTKKCQAATRSVVYGDIGATLRVSMVSSCTDCEQMVVDSDTCIAKCVPDPSKINTPGCYPGNPTECSGTSRAFYFGFPSNQYLMNITELKNINVPFNSNYSQNRKFNCMDCGIGTIDETKSFPPYVAVCK